MQHSGQSVVSFGMPLDLNLTPKETSSSAPYSDHTCTHTYLRDLEMQLADLLAVAEAAGGIVLTSPIAESFKEVEADDRAVSEHSAVCLARLASGWSCKGVWSGLLAASRMAG